MAPPSTPQPLDEPQSTKFTWRIKEFSKIKTKKLYSDNFSVGGCNWKLLIFPKGNDVCFLSVYLVLIDSTKLLDGKKRFAQFSLAVVNENNSDLTVTKDTHHRFHQSECEWGFKQFMPLSVLSESSTGFLQNDTLVVEVDVAVHNIYCDSKEETGYIGLKKHEQNSKMNCILQILHHIPYFRKVVYQLPETEDDNSTCSIQLALQFLFYKIQCNNTSVSTKEFIKSVGLDSSEPFIELERAFLKKLDEKLKGTAKEGAILALFQGHISFMDTIKSFYDLLLQVSGCMDVYASFDKLVEDMEGFLFLDFPPVLLLHLNRFGPMFKIHDRYEFPLELDLDRDNFKYLSPDADKSVTNLYHLHSVLVHGGDGQGGDYQVFIRPTLSDQWYKFDEEKVTKEDEKWALEKQYGGEEEFGYKKFTKYQSAFGLVYIRVSDKDKIICDVDEKDISEHLRLKMRKEQEEKEAKRRYRAEAHLYAIIKVARDEDMKEQVGKNIYFDLVDHDKVRNFRVKKQILFSEFREEVASAFGIRGDFHFWIWSKKQNHTYRADRRLTLREEEQTVGALSEVSSYSQNSELKLFLEVEVLIEYPPPIKTRNDILLFFKLYDPEKEELRYVGWLIVNFHRTIDEFQTKLNEMAGFAANEELLFFELDDGDIICFQKQPPAPPTRFPDVPSFFKFVKNRQIVYFRALEKPEKDAFSLTLMKSHTYDEVVESVRLYLCLDDELKIRLTCHDYIDKQPKLDPIKYRSVDHLEDHFPKEEHIHYILYYEVMETQEVAFRYGPKDEPLLHSIRLLKQGTIGDVLTDITTELSDVNLCYPTDELRLLGISQCRIVEIFTMDKKFEDITSETVKICAEKIPEEEKNLKPTQSLISVYHFRIESEGVQCFGEPFILVIQKGVDTLADVKERINRELKVPDEEFSNWKFAISSAISSDIQYLKDSDIVSDHFQNGSLCEAWLGLEHSHTLVPIRNYQDESQVPDVIAKKPRTNDYKPEM